MPDVALVKAFLEVSGPWGLCGALLVVSIWKDRAFTEALSDRSRSTALLETMAARIKENSDMLGRLIDAMLRDK